MIYILWRSGVGCQVGSAGLAHANYTGAFLVHLWELDCCVRVRTAITSDSNGPYLFLFYVLGEGLHM